MNTYLVASGIVLGTLVLWVIICSIGDKNKKRKAENAKRQAWYQKELEQAKCIWREWAKDLEELQYEYDHEDDPRKRLYIKFFRSLHLEGGCRFRSINKEISFVDLSRENGWTLEDDHTD
ncbi:MAG: hypothetical protein A2373_03005 [Candidatus Magasanikbacteria bacterium RIFOXYB1_FULL_40_15]|uniref:Uncharacterized protein n=1 Tax=Candidatus Magasanikbacteria bacterium RIFOXYB1_FULL_40_15 TaxID=1798697 RepID=A0A1F6NER2_9BACT|nr:MAG: hypothetical protein A2373_03005 [Candidatus Magasanikbacteria bacterium RIFOXYB1_FULL_40_15]